MKASTKILIDRLKEATEGSRDLDSAIAFVTMKRHEDSIYHNEGNGRVTEYGPKNNKTHLIAKELSTNLDKISKYMEALLPNSCFRSGKSFKHRDKFVCNVLINFYKDSTSDSDEGVALPTIIATANTEALSRCLALVIAYDKGYVTYGDNYTKVEEVFVPYGKPYGK